jgi:hypothetical protein
MSLLDEHPKHFGVLADGDRRTDQRPGVCKHFVKHKPRTSLLQGGEATLSGTALFPDGRPFSPSSATEASSSINRTASLRPLCAGCAPPISLRLTLLSEPAECPRRRSTLCPRWSGCCWWCSPTAAARSFPPIGQTGRGLPRSLRNLGLNIAIPASHRWQICSTHEGSRTLSPVAA